jgi:hypothetical protein
MRSIQTENEDILRLTSKQKKIVNDNDDYDVKCDVDVE